MISINITEIEHKIGDVIGGVRNSEAQKKGLEDKHGFEKGTKEPRRIHVEGAWGEIACAKAINVYWEPSVNTFKIPDLDHKIQVRTRGQHHYELIVRSGDANDDYFILVTKSPDDDFNYHIHGFLQGRDAKKREWSQAHGGRSPAYFVPQQSLRPMSELVEMILGKQAEKFGLLAN